MEFFHVIPIYCWLVVGPPLWKIWKSIGMIIPNIYIYMYGKIKNVPNHQSDYNSGHYTSALRAAGPPIRSSRSEPHEDLRLDRLLRLTSLLSKPNWGFCGPHCCYLIYIYIYAINSGILSKSPRSSSACDMFWVSIFTILQSSTITIHMYGVGQDLRDTIARSMLVGWARLPATTWA